MALDKNSVRLGISILKRINKGASVVRYETYDQKDSYVDTNKIFCIGEKCDAGYDNVVTNIEDMTDEQRKLWNELKKEVPNSSFMDKLEEKDYPTSSLWMKEKDKNITRIGWF